MDRQLTIYRGCCDLLLLFCLLYFSLPWCSPPSPVWAWDEDFESPLSSPGPSLTRGPGPGVGSPQPTPLLCSSGSSLSEARVPGHSWGHWPLSSQARAAQAGPGGAGETGSPLPWSHDVLLFSFLFRDNAFLQTQQETCVQLLRHLSLLTSASKATALPPPSLRFLICKMGNKYSICLQCRGVLTRNLHVARHHQGNESQHAVFFFCFLFF